MFFQTDQSEAWDLSGTADGNEMTVRGSPIASWGTSRIIWKLSSPGSPDFVGPFVPNGQEKRASLGQTRLQKKPGSGSRASFLDYLLRLSANLAFNTNTEHDVLTLKGEVVEEHIVFLKFRFSHCHIPVFSVQTSTSAFPECKT